MVVVIAPPTEIVARGHDGAVVEGTDRAVHYQ